MTAGEIGAATARLLFEAGAIQVSRDRPFVLAAGWASPVYVDCRLLIGEPRLWRDAVRLASVAVELMIKPGNFDAIAGAETAGIPLASWLADTLDVPLRYVRKRPLGIGRNAQVEGGPVEGLRVLLVDDLTTDGTSKVSFAKGLRAAGANSERCPHDFLSFGLSRRGRSSRAGRPLVASVGNMGHVLRADLGGRLDSKDRKQIEEFLADPPMWSTRNGGRSVLLQPRNR